VSQVALKMKELEARTGVSREAIHFYLREGLLPEPARPKRNVAHYTEEHVVRIKVIKRLQEERFLPLSVIKTMLDEADLGSVPATDDLAGFEQTFLSLLGGDSAASDHTIAAVANQTGLSEIELSELAELGVIESKDVDGDAWLDHRDAEIVERWARLRELGFNDQSGYDVRFLKRYAETMKRLADAEVDEFLDAFGNTGTDQAAELAAKGIEVANELITRLHTRALTRRLSERVEELAP
jgi:DNA-binding transcriptional MerR regulator